MLRDSLPSANHFPRRRAFKRKRKLDLTGASEMNRLYPNSRRESGNENRYLNTLPRRGENGGRSGQTKTRQNWNEKENGDCKTELAAGTIVELKQEPALITDPNSDLGDYRDISPSNERPGPTECCPRKDQTDGIPPTFAKKPSIRQEDEGRRLLFECRILADPKPTVYWYHDNDPVKESSRCKTTTKNIDKMYTLRKNRFWKRDTKSNAVLYGTRSKSLMALCWYDVNKKMVGG
ncbi:ig-like domain-containing protein [Trichonephila clavipes]|nr:ig-like domain-containing protein [Trichonephila clavipes]